MTIRTLLVSAAALALCAAALDASQAPQGPPQGGPQGRGGPGPMADRDVVADFDADGNKRLDADERKAARAFLESQGIRTGRGGFGPAALPPVSAGARIAPADVKRYGSEPLYEMSTLRTLFLEFESDDWERELTVFANTDVEVPAKVIVDGRTYDDVGIHFRGASSLMGVPEGRKKSLNLSLDYIHEGQQIGGYRTLNLLNSHTDPTYLRTVLYLEAARAYIPAPKANYVRVVINGEHWGVYVSAQQFNKDFIQEWFKTSEGARWKVPGSPNGRGGLEYLGESAAAYKRIYEIKSKDDAKSWTALITLTRTLNETPLEALEAALSPMLDIDGTLKFLALETTLVNADGYWVRASDYSLYLDPTGRFHVIPHDANETFGPGGGRGMGPRRGGPGDGRGGRAGGPPPPGSPGVPMPAGGGRGRGPGAGGPELDPLVGLDDPTKPLRSRLLAVPALRERYLRYVRDIAATWLDWNRLGPLVATYQALIADDVAADTRKLDTTEAFAGGVETLRSFAERRRSYLLR